METQFEFLPDLWLSRLRETELAASFSVSFTECNERKRPISIDKTLLSHHSSVPVSHTFGGLT